MAFACEKGSENMPKGITGLGVETARVTKGKRLYLEGITLDSKRRDKKSGHNKRERGYPF
jgi:hypothetical protein